MTTELCTYTRNACDIARRTGVERIELCAAPLEGGTTPSAGLIRYARSLPGLRLQAGVDFELCDPEDDPRFRQYWETYYQLMKRDGACSVTQGPWLE